MNRALSVQAALWLALVTCVARAQDLPPVWQGVYTAAQAERGRQVAQLHCGRCHSEDLAGGEAPALSGSAFMLNWESHTVERLFHKIRDTMPSRDSTDVSEEEKIDVVAFILQQNGFPAGATELTAGSRVLDGIRIVPRSGAVTPRSGSLVQAVGCLQANTPSGWLLAAGRDPQVTTLEPVPEEEKQSLARAEPGPHTIELMSVYPDPTALRGFTVLVKGLYIKTASATRINVMSLESLGSACSR